MVDVINIEANDNHTVSEVICVRCLKRWICARPSDVLLKDIECPECHLQGAVIETGQDMSIK
jgi:Zn finger protein HypA/HybF involved in hydrogenase expression